MLSEEEKKAIEYLTKYIHWETAGERSLETDIETVLNLITKLQKENKKKDIKITELDEYLERISNDLDNVAIDQIPIAIAELKYNNELKDKQIDLMAEVMFKNNTAQLIIEYGIENKEQIIKEFEKLVKEKGE